MNALLQYEWPGNVRELSNEIRRLVAITPEDSLIAVAKLSPAISQNAWTWDERAIGNGRQRASRSIREIKRQAISEALARHNWNISHAAAELEVTRNGLTKMIRQFNLAPE